MILRVLSIDLLYFSHLPQSRSKLKKIDIIDKRIFIHTSSINENQQKREKIKKTNKQTNKQKSKETRKKTGKRANK